ncbi:MAG: methylated-DNA--[protein]-cysteine S-methyltransferase [Azospirillaceae bacterium]|nr:methylated-DNA--[protein]-cysteine S-methyltransferase [Azospirillaceae bacterium]
MGFCTARDAERAGFRPCKRCRPDQAAGAGPHVAAIVAACRRIETAEELPSLADLAATAHLSPSYFLRRFKAVTGVTPRAYGAETRARRVREGLALAPSVTQAVYDAGFNAGSRFYAQSGSLLGMKPRTYRQRGVGTVIRFAVGRCILGDVLVAATDQGVCAIEFGDDPDDLVRAFQDRFAAATLCGDDPGFAGLIGQVVGLIESDGPVEDLPLDVRGTAFQHRVWQALRQIPWGQTASYAEIARRIGAPTAARAVARACATNPVAVAIPCHRVVRIDGGLSGYRWGVERKRQLLEREGAAVGTERSVDLFEQGHD